MIVDKDNTFSNFISEKVDFISEQVDFISEQVDEIAKNPVELIELFSGGKLHSTDYLEEKKDDNKLKIKHNLLARVALVFKNAIYLSIQTAADLVLFTGSGLKCFVTLGKNSKYNDDYAVRFYNLFADLLAGLSLIPSLSDSKYFYAANLLHLGVLRQVEFSSFSTLVQDNDEEEEEIDESEPNDDEKAHIDFVAKLSFGVLGPKSEAFIRSNRATYLSEKADDEERTAVDKIIHVAMCVFYGIYVTLQTAADATLLGVAVVSCLVTLGQNQDYIDDAKVRTYNLAVDVVMGFSLIASLVKTQYFWEANSYHLGVVRDIDYFSGEPPTPEFDT
jgi:hypothetical protein